MPFVRLIELGRCPAGRGVFVECGDRELAVLRSQDGRDVYVVDNTCPHAGANLSGGAVEGGVVTCPMHQWQFDVKTGVCVDSPRAAVNSYPVEIRDSVVYADLQHPGDADSAQAG